jgi:hypothetical protein
VRPIGTADAQVDFHAVVNLNTFRGEAIEHIDLGRKRLLIAAWMDQLVPDRQE